MGKNGLQSLVSGCIPYFSISYGFQDICSIKQNEEHQECRKSGSMLLISVFCLLEVGADFEQDRNEKLRFS